MDKKYIIFLFRYHENKTKHHERFELLKEENHHPRILYPVKLFFKKKRGEKLIYIRNSDLHKGRMKE